MREAFHDHLRVSGLIPEGARVLVGYSGGADSTCLLTLLHEAGVDVVAGHLHHGQREEAEKELRLCEAYCDGLGIPFASGHADVPQIASDMKIGLEEAGRQARYAFFAQAAFRTQCAWVATAHTRDDQCETILLNLVRGSGLTGLAGIPEKRDQIVRPLLPFSRAETKAFCESRGLWFHDDPSNSDLFFSRARVRHRVMPELRMIHSEADAQLLRLSRIAREEDQFLNATAAAALEQCERVRCPELHFLTHDVELYLDRAKLESLPPVLVKRALRLAVQALGGALTFEQTEAALRGLREGGTGSVTAEGGKVVLEWKEEALAARDLTPTTPFRQMLQVPGEILSEEFGWRLVAYPLTGNAPAQERVAMRALVPRSRIRGELYFRTAHPGDAMRPFGFEGTRKLSDLMSERKLSAAMKARLPIVCDLVGPLWAPGVALDDRARVEAGETEFLALEFGPDDAGTA